MDKENTEFQDTTSEMVREEIIVNPKSNCKICLGRGQIRYWNSNQGTYTKDMFDKVPLQPCQCLVSNYHKIV